MESKLIRSGNSAAVRLPSRILHKADLSIGDRVTIAVRTKGVVTISFVAPAAKRNRITLREMLRGMKAAAPGTEMDWGEPRGEEQV
jgi:antitoxin component of MazEF toxin-antitoxin module